MTRSVPLLMASGLALLVAIPAASRAQEPPATPPATESTTTGKPFLDLGAGARIGIGEPTYAAVSARLGVPLSVNTGLSLRPTVVFGNNDANGSRNSETEVLLPLTLDLFTNNTVSAYVGPGLAFNTDSDGQTNASVNAGVDIKLNQRLRFSTGLTYIFETSDADNRDIEANALLYFRL
jgi:hypothetical protein